jgi:hypothetical protein
MSFFWGGEVHIFDKEIKNYERILTVNYLENVQYLSKKPNTFTHEYAIHTEILILFSC